jgi:hypothetical protein
VRISLLVQLGFLPLLHKLVEERAGERRSSTSTEVYGKKIPLSLSLSPLAQGEGTRIAY